MKYRLGKIKINHTDYRGSKSYKNTYIWHIMMLMKHLLPCAYRVPLGYTVMLMMVVAFYLGNWNILYKEYFFLSNKTKWQIWSPIFLYKPGSVLQFFAVGRICPPIFLTSRIKPNKMTNCPQIFLTRQKCSFYHFPPFSISSPTNTYFTNIYFFLSFTLPRS